MSLRWLREFTRFSMSLTPPRLRRGSVPATAFATAGMGGARPLPPHPPAGSELHALVRTSGQKKAPRLVSDPLTRERRSCPTTRLSVRARRGSVHVCRGTRARTPWRRCSDAVDSCTYAVVVAHVRGAPRRADHLTPAAVPAVPAGVPSPPCLGTSGSTDRLLAWESHSPQSERVPTGASRYPWDRQPRKAIANAVDVAMVAIPRVLAFGFVARCMRHRGGVTFCPKGSPDVVKSTRKVRARCRCAPTMWVNEGSRQPLP